MNFLPLYGLEINPITNFAVIVGVSIVGFAILRYRLFNIRVVTAQFLTLVLVAFSVVRLFLTTSVGERVFNILLLIITLAVGVYLILSVRNEVSQREKIEKLANDLNISNKQLNDLNLNLQKKVNEQTLEIRHSYEIEKKARIELEKLDVNKNDFIIITQHHLRTPLSQIRWYADAIKTGLYGEIPKDLKEAVGNIDIACGRLVKTLNNFLNIAQIKIGVKVLNIEPTDLRAVIEDVLKEFEFDINKKKILVNYKNDIKDWPQVLVDKERIKDVFSILVDNAVKYNQEGGKIDIDTETKGKQLIVSISNTGIGISKEDLPRLFKQSFFRSTEAKKVHPMGMGVGLMVAKTMVEGCKGKVEVENDTNIVRLKVYLPISK